MRDNPKGITTYVGDEAHGGRYKPGRRYKPPQSGKGIRQLPDALIAWNADLKVRGVPVLIRAPLVHYYYELIHPFCAGPVGSESIEIGRRYPRFSDQRTLTPLV